jgi:hypothetical protein
MTPALFHPMKLIVVGCWALLIAFGGSAFAKSAYIGADGRIRACVTPNGHLTVLTPRKRCGKPGSTLVWSREGMVGKRGSPGRPGDAASATSQTIAAAVTGVATAALAFLTFLYLKSARETARASREAAQAAQDQLSYQLRPLVMPSAAGTLTRRASFVDGFETPPIAEGAVYSNLAGGTSYLALRIWNAGAGVAVVKAVNITVGEPASVPEPSNQADFSWWYENMFLPAGTVMFFHSRSTWEDDPENQAIRRQEPMTLDFFYTDDADHQPTITRIALTWKDAGYRAAMVKRWSLAGALS